MENAVLDDSQESNIIGGRSSDAAVQPGDIVTYRGRQYFTLEATKRLLELQRRAIEKLVRGGKLSVLKMPVSGKRPTVIYDIQNVLAERGRRMAERGERARPVSNGDPSTLLAAKFAAMVDALTGIQGTIAEYAALRRKEEADRVQTDKIVMNVTRAAARTGIPRKVILSALTAGEIRNFQTAPKSRPLVSLYEVHRLAGGDVSATVQAKLAGPLLPPHIRQLVRPVSLPARSS